MHRVPGTRKFHLRMAFACATLLAVSVVGCWLTDIHTDILSRVIAVIAVLSMTIALPAYWHDRTRIDLRDSALTIPWAFVLAALLPFPLLIAARLRMPLEDQLFARIDQAFGVRVPEIAAWAAQHWLGKAVNYSYPLLTPMLLAAIFVPALAGKGDAAREFLYANLLAFAMAAPMFALLPAVGPWFYFHFAPTPTQMYCQTELLGLRLPGPYSFLSQGAGFVSFPSFHVIWAVLSARALWGFRLLRVSILVLAGLIVLSTMTTGWHYFSDVVAGALVAVVSILTVRLALSGTGH